MEKALTEAQDLEGRVCPGKGVREKVFAQMVNVRFRMDAIEKLVSKDAWPLPTYEVFCSDCDGTSFRFPYPRRPRSPIAGVFLPVFRGIA